MQSCEARLNRANDGFSLIWIARSVFIGSTHRVGVRRADAMGAIHMGLKFSAQYLTRIRLGIAATVLIGTLGAAACAAPVPPTGTTTTTTITGGIDPELDALLADKDFAAQFGDTEEQRTAILAQVRETLAQESDWTVADTERLRMNAEKAAADDAAIKAEEAAQAQLDLEAADEKKRLDALQSGPELDELAANPSDGSESFDYSSTAEDFSNLEGSAELVRSMTAGYSENLAKVNTVVEELRTAGRLDALDQIPGYVPPEGGDDPQFAEIWWDQVKDRGPATGACLNRDSSRSAPSPASLRPGTIYSPYQNTFAPASGSPTQLGQLKTTMIAGRKHFIVEGHLGDLDASAAFAGLAIQTMVRARITLHTPGNIVSNYNGIEFLQIAVPGQPVASGQIQVLCYEEDLGLPAAAPIRRAMFRAYIPFDPSGIPLAEPGFQVKATVSNNAINPGFFFGADMRTVYLGKQPVAYNSTFTNGGFGVTASKGVVTEDNGVSGDDLESTIAPPVSNAISNGLSGLDGSSNWVLGKKGGNWGWFGYHINNSAPTTANVNIDWDQTSYASAGDDEHRLKGTLSMNDWLIQGYVTMPWAFGGIVPCYFQMKVDWSATVYASVDINDTARTILQPDIQIGPVGLNIHNMLVSPLPLGCNFLYTAKWINGIDDLVNEALPIINGPLFDEIGNQPGIPNAVPATVAIGGGNNMQVLFAGWNNTCLPYGCNGGGAGDMAMSWAGLEATGDFRFTDTKAVGATRRFPASYSPTTGNTANGRVRQHFGAQNEITDFSAWVNPAMLNQALRVMAEHGRLDLGSSPTSPTVAQSPPIYLSTPLAADKPLGLFLPHVEINDTAAGNIYALDAIAAVGVTFDTGTRKLVPAPVSPGDPAFGIAAWTLKCSSAVWLTCYGLPAFVSTAANYVANTLLNPLLQNSIGQVTIPNTGGFPLTNLKIVNEDGHLGIRTSVGASQLRAWGGMDAATYNFDSFWEGLPDTGPVTYTWSIKDNVSGAVIFTTTSQQHQLSGFPTAALTPMPIGFGSQNIRSVSATITATRGSVSKTASYTNQTLS